MRYSTNRQMYVLIFLLATIFVSTESGKFTAIFFAIYHRDFRVNDTAVRLYLRLLQSQGPFGFNEYFIVNRSK